MALNQLQDFYKQTIITPCGAGAGKIYVSALPVPVNGYLVISPSNQALREVVRYTGTGTDGSGAYVTIVNVSDRGLGGTTAQSHAIGESIRMNITAEHWADLIAEITGYAPINNPTFTGVVTVPTPVNPTDAVTKDYADTKASLVENQTFEGANVFSGGLESETPIKAPDPVDSDDVATKNYVLSIAFGGSLLAGLISPEINYRQDGQIQSIHDTDNGTTYVFVYDVNDILIAITDSTSEWAIRYDSDYNVTSIYKH